MPVRQHARLMRCSKVVLQPTVFRGAGTSAAGVTAICLHCTEMPRTHIVAVVAALRIPSPCLEIRVVPDGAVGCVFVIAGNRIGDRVESSPRIVIMMLKSGKRADRILLIAERKNGIGMRGLGKRR